MKKLPFRTIYVIAFVLFVLLEIGAIVTTKIIIRMGGQEVYPLAVNLVNSDWFLWGSKLVALSLVAVPLAFLPRKLAEYQHQIKLAFVVVCAALGFILSVASFDVTHNIIQLVSI